MNETPEERGATPNHPILDFIKDNAIAYGRFLRALGLGVGAIVLVAFIAVLWGLVAGRSSGLAAGAIAVGGFALALFVIAALPILLPVEALARSAVAASLRRGVLFSLRLLYGLLVVAVLVALVPEEASGSTKLMFVGVMLLLGFGITIGTVGWTWGGVNRLAKLQLLLVFGFLGVALTFPMTGGAAGELRVRMDRWLRRELTGPRILGSVAQRQLTCATIPERLFTERGAPLLWYFKSADGRYEIFDQAGHHPIRRVDLVPVATDADVAGIQRMCEQEREAARLGTLARQRAAAVIIEDSLRREDGLRAARVTAAAQAAALEAGRNRKARLASYMASRTLPARVDYIVRVSPIEHATATAIETEIVADLSRRGKPATSAVLSRVFVSSGAFDRFFDGSGQADLREMGLQSLGHALLLARVQAPIVSRSTTVAGLTTATLVVHFSAVSPADGSVQDRFTLSGVGGGTGEQGATSVAIRRILDQLASRGY